MKHRTVLLIAYHYPPCATSSGLQRTLSFSIHLRKFGWQPVVLSVCPSAYERTSVSQLSDIPPDVQVSRTLAVDAARHLAIGGRHWGRLTRPDRWSSWRFTAVPRGLQLIRQHHIDAIWSTYPIATAHSVGATLARLTGLPWVSDFRDPMVEYLQETGEFSPANPSLRAARLRVEAKAAERATRLVFCTDAARRITLERYPNLPCERLAVITNGYEETAFRDAEALRAPRNPGGRRVLLHSGTIYPGPDRDPSSLLKALRFLADRGLIAAGNFELRLRDPSHEQYFRRLAEQHGVPGLVSVMPPISYREALAEMLDADALLLLQGYSSNPAIPAKLYEYLRAARPILGLVDPAGETAATLRAACIESMAPLTDANAIADLLSRWLRAEVSLESALPPPDFVASYSRERLAERLASLLDEVADSTCTA